MYKSLSGLLVSPQSVVGAAQLVFNKFYRGRNIRILTSTPGHARVVLSNCIGWDENMWNELTGRWMAAFLVAADGDYETQIWEVSGAEWPALNPGAGPGAADTNPSTKSRMTAHCR